MFDALREYDETIAALIVHDEAHDPDRAGLLRALFAAQRLYFHGLAEMVHQNSAAVQGLAERVQGHISGQLLDVMAAQQEGARQHTTILQRIGAQDAMLHATHEKVNEIALILARRIREEDRAA